MNSAYNSVVVRPDEDLVLSSGFHLPTDFDPQHNFSIGGEVLVVPKKLVCNGGRIRNWMKSSNKLNVRVANRTTHYSLQYDTSNELLVGDKVLYMFTAKFEPESFRIGENLMIPYDLLYAKVLPGGVLYPLNGYVIIRVSEKSKTQIIDDVFTFVIDDVNNYGTAEVVAVGSKLKGYRDYDDKPNYGYKPGDVIYYDKRFSWRMEMDFHNSLNKGRQSSLFCLQQKDVLSWTSRCSTS